MRMKFALVALILCIRANATEVSGTIYGTWSPSGNPYLVVGDITVPASQFLTIQAGVEVRFLGNFSILVQGGMTAHGTETDSVLFVYNYGQAPGLWKYIQYQDAWGDSTMLRYCRIESGERAVWVEGCQLILDHCLIHTHEMSPIKGQDGELTLTACIITNNGGSALSLENTSASLYDCEISYSGGTFGRGINASNGGTLVVEGGFIGHNAGSGIYATNISTTQLEGVEISHNEDSGIDLTNCGQLTAARLLVHHNGVHGLFLSSTTMNSHNLTISSNGGYGVFCYGGVVNLSSAIVDRNSQYGIYLQSASGFLYYNDAYENTLGGYSGCTAGYGSIAEDPQYYSFTNDDFNLQAGSPCIDTGDPNDPLDPDETRTDMGALFYNQSPVSPETGTDQPHNLQIIATYPNPFNSSLNIRVYAAKTSNVSLSIWNVEGQQIAQIWQGTLQSGINQFNWSAEHIPSGVYLVRLQAGETVQIQRCILLK